MLRLTALFALALPLPAQALDLDDARDLAAAGRHAEAAAALAPMAAAGNPEAEEALGALLALGLGSRPDPGRAFDLYQRAAGRGLASAQASLAAAYEAGRGTAPDPVRAYLWYALAAIGGDPAAPAQRDRLAALIGAEGVRAGDALLLDWKPLLYPDR